MPLTVCPSCGTNKKGFTPLPPEKYSTTEWLICNNCGSKIFRVGSSLGF